MTDTSPTIDAIERVAIIGGGAIGRSFAELTAERDDKLIRILEALGATRRP